MPKGYPPIVDYSLVSSDSIAGDVLLAPGPINIYLRRREEADTTMGVGSGNSSFDLIQYRLTSLYRLSGKYMPLDTTALKSKQSVNITWSTIDALETTVEETVNDLKKEWRALKASLVKGELLTEEDSAALPIKLSLSITDNRFEGGLALPTAKDLEARLFGVK